MTIQTKPNSIVITGRRWFQRSYGNTYHTVQVHVDSELVYTSGITYGYESQYQQTAEEWLIRNQYLNLPDYSPYESLRMYCERVGIGYVCTVSDVSREKDL